MNPEQDYLCANQFAGVFLTVADNRPGRSYFMQAVFLFLLKCCQDWLSAPLSRHVFLP